MSEPAHNYARVKYGGKTVNARTRTMLDAAAVLFGKPFTLTQGSYSRSVAASAGTHDGGGVVDVNTSGMTDATRKFAEQCLRKVGFFAWVRVPPAFGYHIHAVAIGDREMSSAARAQVVQGFQDRNGLANHGPDAPRDPYPAWVDAYGHHVSLDRPPSTKPWIWEAGPWVADKVTNSTRIVQRALNAEFTGADLAVDGKFGAKSKARYAQWQLKLGLVGKDADGSPGPWSLRKLGAKHGFDVRKP